ncbi:MAG: hypothetical protein ACQEP2_09085 [Actinomycetota bacterium]
MLHWKIITAIVVIVGGISVIGSYIIGAIRNPVGASALWGGVSKNIIPYYVLGMVLSAIGFLATAYYLFFKIDISSVKILGGLDFRFFIFIYLLILVPSALWMPLTIRMVNNPSSGLVAGIQIVLILVAIGALLMFVSLLTLSPKVLDWSYYLSVIGSGIFFLHAAVLDASLWTTLFFRNYR